MHCRTRAYASAAADVADALDGRADEIRVRAVRSTNDERVTRGRVAEEIQRNRERVKTR